MPAKGGGPTEKEWQQVLVDLLTALGWRHSHTYPLRTQHGWRTGTTWRGFPDLICVRPPYVVCIEAKTDTGRADPEQIECLTMFAAVAGGRSWVLRPRDDIHMIAGWLRNPKDAPRVYGFTPKV